MKNMTLTDKQKNLLFYVILFLFIGHYFFIKFQTPVFVENLVNKNSLELLNDATGATGVMPLGFYLGKIEEVITGPMGVVMSSILFAIICLSFLREAKARTFALAVAGFLLIKNFS